jgi:hypothetical protein
MPVMIVLGKLGEESEIPVLQRKIVSPKEVQVVKRLGRSMFIYSNLVWC